MASTSAFLALLASFLGALHQHGLFDRAIDGVFEPAAPEEPPRACLVWDDHQLSPLRKAFVDAALYPDQRVEAIVGAAILLSLIGVWALLLVLWRCVSCRQQPPRAVRRSLSDGSSRAGSRGPAGSSR